MLSVLETVPEDVKVAYTVVSHDELETILDLVFFNLKQSAKIRKVSIQFKYQPVNICMAMLSFCTAQSWGTK